MNYSIRSPEMSIITHLLLLSGLLPLVSGRIDENGFETDRVKRNSQGTGSYRDWQWYLKSTQPSMNVGAAWRAGYTGKGVLVAVVDDGVNMNHPDLESNFNVESSYDFWSGRNISKSHSPGSHGTYCAGVIAGENNNNCGVGVAYNAQISSIRLFNANDKPSDQSEASALMFRRNFIDIYSNSWGPGDMGWELEGPGPLLADVLEKGTQLGRRKKGSIFVFAAGNGGLSGDSCAFSGYVNSIYTIAISGVNWDGEVPGYAERCGAIMAVTYGQDVIKRGNVKAPMITTKNGKGCTEDFPGTSGPTAMASGIIALALEANENLTWRDIQHLIVRSSKPLRPPNRVRTSSIKRRNPSWKVNDANIQVSHYFGFGLMDAYDMVRYAKKWTSVPQQLHCEVDLQLSRSNSSEEIPWSGQLVLSLSVNKSNCGIRFLEHVQVEIDLTFLRRGYLEMSSKSPRGTWSQLLYPRAFDSLTGQKKFEKWTVSSLHYWGEKPDGDWEIIIKNSKPWRRTRNALTNSFSTVELPTQLNIIKSTVGNSSDWSSWSECSVTCGNGIQQRTRPCTQGSSCEGSDKETKTCSRRICPKPAPINGGYSDWSDWSPCSRSCEGGSRERRRSCTKPLPANGGADCRKLGRNWESRRCNVHKCPGHLFSLKLILYGTNKDPLAKNPHVERRTKRLQDVHLPQRREDIPVHGGFTQWSSWTSCSKSCGEGLRSRSRSCTKPRPLNKGKGCSGSALETRTCNMGICPVWSKWSECSPPCGRGTRSRYLSCPTRRDCRIPSSRREVKRCFTNCPVAGNHSRWSIWSECSVTCGNGIQKRTRTCIRGSSCEGSDEETRTCSGGICPKPVITSTHLQNNWGDRYCNGQKNRCKQDCQRRQFKRGCARTCELTECKVCEDIGTFCDEDPANNCKNQLWSKYCKRTCGSC
ncbi:furin-like [Stylophora pistillata]|uniref:furin-like n=1 Tax=Stylophora pistillata TaxID=50429 RepID=UPI000C055A5A|nr:furin-like [Stylophora pistillata]